jgi:hypothetical protein
MDQDLASQFQHAQNCEMFIGCQPNGMRTSRFLKHNTVQVTLCILGLPQGFLASTTHPPTPSPKLSSSFPVADGDAALVVCGLSVYDYLFVSLRAKQITVHTRYRTLPERHQHGQMITGVCSNSSNYDSKHYKSWPGIHCVDHA